MRDVVATTKANAEKYSYMTTASLITTAAAVGLQWRCPGANATAHVTAVPRFKGHSQQGEDVALVHSLFCDQCGADHSRTYVEIGALDGVMYSNTLGLEALGWRGLLIEAQPGNAAALYRNRGRSGRNVIVPEAVCSPASTVTFAGMKGKGTAGAIDTMDKDYFAYWQRRGRFPATYTVPCRPLGEMVRLAGLARIDVFSLDVEGAELAVLRTFDWSVPVSVWLVETFADGLGRAGGGSDKHREIVALLNASGYAEHRTLSARVGHNTIFVHRELLPLVEERVLECRSLLHSQRGRYRR